MAAASGRAGRGATERAWPDALGERQRKRKGGKLPDAASEHSGRQACRGQLQQTAMQLAPAIVGFGFGGGAERVLPRRGHR